MSNVLTFCLKDKKKFQIPDNNDNNFTIDNWPVPTSNEPYLNELKDTHFIQRLPAYDIRGCLVHPLDYEEKLTGAVVCACFTIIHYMINKKHIFNAVVQDLTVLCPPTSISPSNSNLK